MATEQVFGSDHKRPGGGRKAGRTAALKTTEQLREHDSALTEAHELLSQWMEEKVNLSVPDSDYNDNALHQRALQGEVKREWDHLLENNYDEESLYRIRKTEKEEDPYAFLDKMDEASAVDSIIQHMLNKKVVKDTFTEDLGLNEWTKHKDPRTKMQLRHQQVKENREKREKELERKRKDQQAKKDALHQAKQIVLREERDKVMKAKREDMEIKKEMAKIRKEMQEERRRAEEEKHRERMKKELIEQEARLHVDQEDTETLRHEMERQKTAEERQRQLVMRLGEIEARQHANNLKILQRHFSAWYNVVLERRIQMGKARALADWRLILRAWNAWKSYCRSRAMEVEARLHQQDVIQTQRKNQLAGCHHRESLLRKYFVAWQQWVKQEQDRKELEHAQEKTRNKMAALLEAAASGKLNTERSEGGDTTRVKSARGRATNSELDEFFDNQPRRPMTSLSLASPSFTNQKSAQRDVRQSRIPTEAWQVSRKHLNLTTEEMTEMGGDDQSEHSDVKIRKRFGTQPWMNTKYVTNNFENRHNAQQKILKDQQRQLQEQKKMIEELRFQQQQQMLTQQAKNLQEIQTLIENQPLSDVTLPAQETVVYKGVKKASLHVDNDANSGTGQDSKTSPSAAKKVVNKTVTISEPNTEAQGTGSKGNVTNRTELSHGGVTERSTATSAASTSTKSNTKYLNQLKKMEDRAAERARLKAERDEKRRKAEEERLEKLRQEEEELKKREEDEKRARIEAYREKKRLEKQKEIDKQQREEKLRQQTIMADAHYLRSLLKYKGMVRFKTLVEMSRQYEVKADRHYKLRLKRSVFREWHQNVQDIILDKEKLADKMYQYLLIKHCFNNWRKVKHHIAILEGRAKRYYQRNIKSKIFQAWYEWAMEEKIRSYDNNKKAEEHYQWLLLSRSFKTWRIYPEEKRKEKDREKRRQAMREAVAALIPDFEGMSPRRSNDNS
ncbi:hypothetical protein FSP39_023636 [Pinctada imbricata]|uniref:Uncharacterized protein n=1 Tax=Pinctada imbricata TaxID=66713 RepID=A0AA88YL85_PINIB|nr:hypothetical protein FSP39_023636 [Pinctada imbricata]